MFLLDDLNEFFIVVTHVGIIGLHAAEISEAHVLTLGLFVAIGYMVMSCLEVKKIYKDHHLKVKGGSQNETRDY